MDMPETSELKIGGLNVVDILGMGEVGISYKARDNDDNIIFLKVIKWEYSRREDELQQEFSLQRLSQLSHPGLAKVFDVGYTTAGKIWYTREIFPSESSETLDSVLRGLDEIGSSLLILQILDALDFLHRNGLIHGNLKSGNIRLIRGDTKSDYLWRGHRKSKSLYTVKLTESTLLEPFGEFDDDSILPRYKSESDDLRRLGDILYKIYIDDLSVSGYSIGQIRDRVPEPLQELVARLVGVSREPTFRSCFDAIKSLRTLELKRGSDLNLDKIRKNVQLAKDVGRQNFLLDMLSDTEQGNGRFIILEGEDGSGKTVLVREFAKVAVDGGKQISIITNTNYHHPAEGLIRLLDDISILLKGKNPALLNHYEQVISRIKGERIPDAGLAISEASTLFEGLVSFFKEVAQIKPFCLIFEDIELASDYTLSFLAMLLADIGDSPILVVSTLSPSRIRNSQQKLFDMLFYGEHVNRIQIQPLDYANTIDHIRYLLTAPELPEEVCARFFESTGGNILKLDELVRLSVSEGALSVSKDSHNFDVRKFSDIAERAEANSLISRSVSKLHSNERAICQCIAMLGGKSSIEIIETIALKSDLIEAKSRKYLANLIWGLVAKGILRRRAEAGGYFFFISHKLFSEGIISLIPAEERKKFYNKMVHALERADNEMSMPEKDIEISLLALKGSDPESAFTWAVRAQAMCERQLALEKRKFFLIKLLQMIPEEGQEYSKECRVKLAYTHSRLGEHELAEGRLARIRNMNPSDEALAAIISQNIDGLDSMMFLEKAVNQLDQIHEPMLRKQVLIRYLSQMQSNDPRRALEYAKNCSVSSENPADKISCYMTASRLTAAAADFNESMDFADKALTLAKGTEFLSDKIRISIWKIKLTQMMGNQTKTSRLIRRTAGMISSSWDLKQKADYFRLASKFYSDVDDSSSALKYLADLVSVELKLQSKKPLARALLQYGIALDRRGDTEKSRTIVDRARRIAEEIEDNFTLAKSLIMVGNHYLEAELFDQAQVSLERADRLLGDLGDEEASAQVAESLGRICVVNEDIEKARTYSNTLSMLAESTASDLLHAKSLRLNGIISAFMEKWDKAEEYYTSALRIFETKKLKRMANALKIDLAHLFVRQEDYFRALSKLSEAAMFFEDDGGAKELKRIQKTELQIDKELGKYGEDYRNLRMLLEISRALVEVENLNELLPMIVDMALKVTGAERGFIMLLTKSRSLDFRFGRNNKKENLTPDEFAFSSSVTDSVLSQKRLVSITDTESDEKFKARDSIVGLSLRSIMASPLKITEEIIGLIYVDSQVPTFYFSKKNAEFFEALCSHAATAISYAELKTKNSQFDALLEENKALKDLKKIQRTYFERNIDSLSETTIHLEKKLKMIQGASASGGDITGRIENALEDMNELTNIIDQFRKEAQNYS